MIDFNEQILRTTMIVGENSRDKIKALNILVVGLGGVGSYALEAIARVGVMNISICDNDVVAPTNINRQLCALHSTVGKYKADVLAERVLDINPNVNLTVFKEYYSDETKDIIINQNYDYIIDAIDSVTSKINLIQTAKERNIPIISALGTGNKFNPALFEITDISKTSVCPLARVMRKELKNRGIYKHTVVYSKEIPKKPENLDEIPEGKGNVPGSISFVPPVCGFLMASHVINSAIFE